LLPNRGLSSFKTVLICLCAVLMHSLFEALCLSLCMSIIISRVCLSFCLSIYLSVNLSLSLSLSLSLNKPLIICFLVSLSFPSVCMFHSHTASFLFSLPLLLLLYLSQPSKTLKSIQFFYIRYHPFLQPH
jgi:hypothetical protein